MFEKILRWYDEIQGFSSSFALFQCGGGAGGWASTTGWRAI